MMTKGRRALPGGLAVLTTLVVAGIVAAVVGFGFTMATQEYCIERDEYHQYAETYPLVRVNQEISVVPPRLTCEYSIAGEQQVRVQTSTPVVAWLTVTVVAEIAALGALRWVLREPSQSLHQTRGGSAERYYLPL